MIDILRKVQWLPGATNRAFSLILFSCVLIIAFAPSPSQAGLASIEQQALMDMCLSMSPPAFGWLCTNYSFACFNASWNNAIKCDTTGTTITELRIESIIGSNATSGSISSAITNLSNLTSLFISNTKFGLTTSLPSELAALSRLLALTLRYEAFNGAVPSFIGNLSSLQSLEISYCGFSGTLPDSFRQLTNLSYLSLVGCIEISSLGVAANLSRLRILQLDSHRTWVDFFVSATAPLESLSIRNVTLSSSTFPSSLSRFPLRSLLLARCRLSGALPSLAAFTYLTALVLSSNNFTSVIPFEYFNHQPQFEHLMLNANQLTGTLPAANAPNNLTFLTVANNQLAGSLDVLNNFSRLSVVVLSNNRFAGSLPAFAPTASPVQMEFDNNQLTGTIPSSYFRLSSVQTFLVRGNRFSNGSSNCDTLNL